MNPRLITALFLALLGLLAIFVIASSASLPAQVASHFGASGNVDGFMSRNAYVISFVLLVVALPMVTYFLPAHLARAGSDLLNIPNRKYWLAPERREETRAFLAAHCASLGAIIAVFLAYVHWLVVQANQTQPPMLAFRSVLPSLLALLASLGVWLLVLHVRFRKCA